MNKLLKFSKIASIILLILCLIRLINFYKLPYILEIIANSILIIFSFSIIKIAKSASLKTSCIPMAIGGCIGLISSLCYTIDLWIWLDEYYIIGTTISVPHLIKTTISVLYFIALCFAFYTFHKCFKSKKTISKTALYISILFAIRFILFILNKPYLDRWIIGWIIDNILMLIQYLLFSRFYLSISRINENKNRFNIARSF